MRHRDHYELSFGQHVVSIRRRGSSRVHTANILGSEPIPGTDLVRVWLDRLVFDTPDAAGEGWSADGAVSTVLEVSRLMMEVPQHDRS